MKIILTTILLQIAFIACAQHPFAWQLTENEGLPSMEVYDLYQDSKGYMWMGTDKGLCKYNGQNFYYYKNEHQKGHSLSGIQEGKNGRIWVRNFKNQIFYVEGDSLHYFSALEEIGPFAIGIFFVDSKGNLWLSEHSNTTLYTYHQDIGQWTKKTVFNNDTILTIQQGILDIKETSSHDFFVMAEDGLYKIENDSLFWLTKDNFLRRDIGNGVQNVLLAPTLTIDNYNQLYILQKRKLQYGIQKLSNYSSISPIDSFPNKNYFKSKRSHTLRCLSDNSIWQLTLDGGVAQIINGDYKNNLSNNLILFPNEGISDIILDHEGNYWVSSLKYGVHIIPSLSIQKYTPENSIFPKASIGILAKTPNENLLLSTDQGKILSYNVNKKKIVHHYKTPNVTSNDIFCSNEKLLVNGNGFLWMYNLEDSIHSSYHIYDPLQTKNALIYKNSLVIGAMGAVGLSISPLAKQIGTGSFKKNLFSYIPTKQHLDTNLKINVSFKNILTKRVNWVFADASNNRFLAAREDSLMCYPERGQPFSILDENQKAIQALKITSSKNGIIWVNTNNKGIYGLNKKLKVIYHFTTANGLLDNTIKKISPDGNNLWLLSNNGIQFWNPRTRVSRVYSLQDGLPTLEIKDIVVLKDKIWLSSLRALVSFNKNIPSQNNTPPLIYIKNVNINEKDTVLAPSYNLEYTQSTITINLEGISFRSQGKFKYQYRMLGIDNIWRTQASNINFVRFFQLLPGNYTFEVKTINEDGVQSSVPAKIEFVIAPPYWQTWWFFSLIGGTIILIILAIVWNQLSRQRLRNRVSALRLQALQSQMNPHFVFNAMSTIQSFWVQKQPKVALIYHAKFAKLMRLIFDYSKEVSIHIEDELEFLKIYTSLEQIRFEDEVEVIFEVEDQFLEEDVYIPPLLIQPIVENSFKHGFLHKKGKGKF